MHVLYKNKLHMHKQVFMVFETVINDMLLSV